MSTAGSSGWMVNSTVLLLTGSQPRSTSAHAASQRRATTARHPVPAPASSTIVPRPTTPPVDRMSGRTGDVGPITCDEHGPIRSGECCVDRRTDLLDVDSRLRADPRTPTPRPRRRAPGRRRNPRFVAVPTSMTRVRAHRALCTPSISTRPQRQQLSVACSDATSSATICRGPSSFRLGEASLPGDAHPLHRRELVEERVAVGSPTWARPRPPATGPE